MVYFSDFMFVKRLEIYCPSWFSFFLGMDDHSVTPSDWFTERHRFYDILTHVYTFFNIVLPVYRNWY